MRGNDIEREKGTKNKMMMTMMITRFVADKKIKYHIREEKHIIITKLRLNIW